MTKKQEILSRLLEKKEITLEELFILDEKEVIHYPIFGPISYPVYNPNPWQLPLEPFYITSRTGKYEL